MSNGPSDTSKEISKFQILAPPSPPCVLARSTSHARTVHVRARSTGRATLARSGCWREVEDEMREEGTWVREKNIFITQRLIIIV